MLIHGHYRFATKRASCRNDYCTHCRRQTFVEGFRSFRVIHLYYVPLIPLGFVTDWFCTQCRKDPAGKRPISPPLAIGGLLAGLAGLAIVALIPEEGFDPNTRWAMVAVFTALAVGMIYLLWRGGSAEYLDNRHKVIPLSKDVCPYCGNETLQRLFTRCDHCEVVIR